MYVRNLRSLTALKFVGVYYMQNDMQTMFLEHSALAVYLISFSLWYFMQPSNFQINNKSNPGLHQFCFTSSCDWFRKLMPLSQPICCKTEMGLKPITNCSSCFLALFAPWLLLLLLFLFSMALKLLSFLLWLLWLWF